MEWLTEYQLIQLKQWFTGYVGTFRHDDLTHQRNYILKEEHTHRVCEEILTIGGKIGLNTNELLLAEAIALFHDIGRFEQYARYHTFSDLRSENHAELGLTVLAREGTLSNYDDRLQHIIVQSIRHHNHAKLPSAGDADWLLFGRLLRDADKLDIWRVVIDYYERKDGLRNETIQLDLPDTPGYSIKVVQDLHGKEVVNFKHLRNLNDFKLLQMGWVFDINFAPACQIIIERGYLEKIRQVLPKDPQIDTLYHMMRQHLTEQYPGVRF